MDDLSRSASAEHELLLHEVTHRCANDLQLVVGLLALQGRRAERPEVRASLDDAAARVAALASARAELGRERHPSIAMALRRVCQALHGQAEPRGVLVTSWTDEGSYDLTADQVAMLTMAVNELVTNAIKHAFVGGRSGRVRVDLRREDGATGLLTVDDDGLPFSGSPAAGTGLGFGLVRRLVTSVGGVFRPPMDGAKRFEIRMPC